MMHATGSFPTAFPISRTVQYYIYAGIYTNLNSSISADPHRSLVPLLQVYTEIYALQSYIETPARQPVAGRVNRRVGSCTVLARTTLVCGPLVLEQLRASRHDDDAY